MFTQTEMHEPFHITFPLYVSIAQYPSSARDSLDASGFLVQFCGFGNQNQMSSIVQHSVVTRPCLVLCPPDSRAGEGSPRTVDHAVIGGVVAVVVFAMLCLLIVLGRYFARHKGKDFFVFLFLSLSFIQSA